MFRLFIIALLFPLTSFGQNLVSNNGFEILSFCPSGPSMPNAASGWSMLVGTSDCFHTCAAPTSAVQPPSTGIGFQHPRTGDGMGGFVTIVTFLPAYREYLMTPLSSPLVSGQQYELTVFVNLSEFGSLACSNIEFHFSNGPVPISTNPTSIVPQIVNPATNFISDSTAWTAVTGQFIAAGGEDHLLIGNFKDDFSTSTIPNPHFDVNAISGGPYAYYFIDDICLIPSGASTCGIILPEDGIALDVAPGKNRTAELTWEAQSSQVASRFRIERGATPSALSAIGQVMAVPGWESQLQGFTDPHPLTGTNWYRVVQENEDGSEALSELVRHLPAEEQELLVNLWVDADEVALLVSEACEARLYDIGGRELGKSETEAGEFEIHFPLAGFAAGIYLVSVSTPKGRMEHRKFIYAP